MSSREKAGLDPRLIAGTPAGVRVDPGGVTAISRGLSEATPPDMGLQLKPTPEEVAATILAQIAMIYKRGAWHFICV